MSVYVVESYGSRVAIIDAVYPTEQQADERAQRLQTDGYEFAIHCYPYTSFPLYAIEEARGIFRYGTKTDILNFLASLERKSHPDYEYCTIHILGEQWESPSPGEDNMGLLPHDHVDNDYLDAGRRNWLK